MQRTYGAGTGLLVSGGSRVSGAGVPIIGGGGIEAPAGSTHVGYVQFVGVRTIDVRAPAGPLPERVRHIGGLNYGCLHRTQIYGQVVDMPCEAHFQVVARGDGWLLLQGTLSMQYPTCTW